MKFKILFVIVLAVFMESCASRKNEAYTYVSPYTATPPPVGHSALVYGLPQTRLFFEVELSRTMIKKGPYAEYANRMLGLVNVPTNDSETWQIKSMKISNRQEIDSKQLYTLSFVDYPHNIDKLLRFTREGLILDLNVGNVLIDNHDVRKNHEDFQLANMLVRNTSVERFDTVYQTINLDTAFMQIPIVNRRVISRTTEELARDAVEQIFEIRKWRTEILRGDVEYPSDGEAFRYGLQKLDIKEEQLLSLFIGAKIETRQTVTFSALPEASGNTVELFHFSERAGIVNKGTTGAQSVWYETAKTNSPPSIIPAFQARDVVYYRLPQIVEVTVGIDRNILVNEQVTIYQFGNIVSFPLK